jgi:hypothetical protein
MLARRKQHSFQGFTEAASTGRGHGKQDTRAKSFLAGPGYKAVVQSGKIIGRKYLISGGNSYALPNPPLGTRTPIKRVASTA